MFSFLFLKKMSHWLNHDPFGVDRHARRQQDRQLAWNAVGAGLTALGGYAMYRLSSSKKMSRKRKASGDLDPIGWHGRNKIARTDRGPDRRRRRRRRRTPMPGEAGGSNWQGTPVTPQSLKKSGTSSSSFPENNSVMPRNAVARRRDARGRFVARARVRRARRYIVYRKKSFSKVSRKGRRKSSRRRYSAKGKLKRRISFAKYGSVKTREDGSTITDPQCCYIGHAIAFGQLYESICRAIIRELFRQKGELITDWTDEWMGNVNTMSLIYKYGLPSAMNLSQASVNFPSATSYTALADLLMVSFKANLAPSTTSVSFVVYDIWLAEQTDSTHTVALINFNQCSLNFFVKSTLKVQNATHAADTDENDQFTDIHNRPVVGKVYQSKRQLTGFIPNSRYLRGFNEVGYQGYLANYVSGLIRATNATTLVYQTKKPPPGYFFNANASYVKVSPGQIKTFRWTYKKTFNSSAFLSKFSMGAHPAGPLADRQYPIGPAQMIGLEKEIDIRTVNESNIVLGYQINQSYCCALTKRLPKATTIMDVTAFTP